MRSTDSGLLAGQTCGKISYVGIKPGLYRTGYSQGDGDTVHLEAWMTIAAVQATEMKLYISG